MFGVQRQILLQMYDVFGILPQLSEPQRRRFSLYRSVTNVWHTKAVTPIDTRFLLWFGVQRQTKLSQKQIHNFGWCGLAYKDTQNWTKTGARFLLWFGVQRQTKLDKNKVQNFGWCGFAYKDKQN